MKIAVIVLAGVAISAAVAAGVFAGLYFTDDSDSDAASATAPCGDRMYGHISSLKREGVDQQYQPEPRSRRVGDGLRRGVLRSLHFARP